ncbi:MAG TPA: immunoglobulin domain-containing protein, partial [Verrucomicrobiae bacterium]|nr:immunoglobulin domain-containing protein [Verrucomicrobiae bacterium]
ADYLLFWLNNSQRSGELSSNTDWQLRTYYLPAGTNRLRWIYQKGGNEVSEYINTLYAPADAAWVDEVKFEVWADPLKDTYGDGLPDLWKLRYFDTLDVNPADDPDHDGISNLDEYRDGTNPTSSSSLLPRLTTTSSGGGSIIRNPDLPKYTYNQRVGLNAVPDTNNYFVIWTGAVSGTNTTNSISLTANKSITATFGLPLSNALNAPLLTWTRSGAIGWFGQTNVSHDGVASAQTGPVDSQQDTGMQTPVTGPGALSFWWKASSHTNFDFARFLIDGSEANKISGETDWDPQVYFLPTGSHTLRWTFTNVAGFFSLTNGAWVDEVRFDAGPSAPVILLQPANLTVLQGSNLVLRLVASGNPAPTYQWYFNGISLGGAGTNATLTLSNVAPAQTGNYYAEIRNASRTNTSTPFTLTVLPVPPLNDNFANRAVLPGVVESAGYDFGATVEPNEPNHDNQFPSFSVWWKWTPPATGKYRLLVNSRGIYYGLFAALYTGTTVDNLAPVASASQNGVSSNGVILATVQTVFNATAGSEYELALGHSFGPAGYLTLQMLPVVSPPNDDFANRIPLSGSQVLTNGSNLDATLEPGEPVLPGFPGGASVWWAWAAPRAGMVEVTIANAGFSPLLGVYTGSALNGLSLIAPGVPNTNNLASTADFAATAGAVYQISVDGPGGRGGPFQLEIAFKAPLLGGSGFNSSGQFGFSFSVPPNTAYAIDTSTNLSNWCLVTTGTSASGGIVTYLEPPAQAGLMRFYRVRLL